MASKIGMGHNLLESTQRTPHPLRQYSPPYCTKGQSRAQWKSIEGNLPGEQMNSEVLILNARNFAATYPWLEYNKS
jgi:hypothetical protein